jgi:UDP-N-acetylmuramoylalanine--D-glutamate ligase
MATALDTDLIARSDTPVVVGLGSTGLSIARYLQRCGVDFVVVDSRHNPPGLDQLRAHCPAARIILGEFPASELLAAGRLVVSPGIALTEPAVAQAIAAGVPVCGDVDLFCAAVGAPVIGITGSNAKSTVTELLGAMARRAGLEARVGGNLGTPALDLLDPEADCYILELSSFQLERAGVLQLDVATILNVSNDHLDRHGTMSNYLRAKQRIFAGCHKLVCNRDDDLSKPAQSGLVPNWSYGLSVPVQCGLGLVEREGAEWLSYQGELLMPAAELAMVGRHNISNALAALALGMAMDLPMATMLDELREFAGLPHRCQLVAQSQGVRYINDSKATNPGATLAALRGLGADRNLLLIAGGQGKGADFSVLVDEVAARCKGVILIGEDAASLEAALQTAAPVYRATSMAAAVSVAAKLASSADVVLLSPACASFDMFSGFAERGQHFTRCVLAQITEGARA